MRYGSDEHKTFFCRAFIKTHKALQPADLPWPELSASVIQKLAGFGIWDHAIHSEKQVAAKLSAYAAEETDPLLQEALVLQALEENRHAELLKYFLGHYHIPFRETPDDPLPGNLEWGFLRTGAGECIDSFFAFGFIKLSQTGYPQALIDIMESIIEEEARHIVFIQNWILYQRYKRPLPLQPLHFLQTQRAFLAAAWSRLMDMKKLGGAAFTAQARQHENSSLSAKSFIRLCLSENKRRMAFFDPGLARPKMIPRIMIAVSFFL